MVPLSLLATLTAAIVGVMAATPGWAQSARWGSQVLRQPTEWYGSPEARAAADRVLVYQSGHGAWPRNTDLFAPIEPAELDNIDNGATTRPMRFLSLVHRSAPDERYRLAFARGADYLLRSQYANGGFPQVFPLRGDGYHSRITYNDGVMARALALLHDVARGQAPYDLVDDGLRNRGVRDGETKSRSGRGGGVPGRPRAAHLS